MNNETFLEKALSTLLKKRDELFESQSVKYQVHCMTNDIEASDEGLELWTFAFKEGFRIFSNIIVVLNGPHNGYLELCKALNEKPSEHGAITWAYGMKSGMLLSEMKNNETKYMLYCKGHDMECNDNDFQIWTTAVAEGLDSSTIVVSELKEELDKV